MSKNRRGSGRGAAAALGMLSPVEDGRGKPSSNGIGILKEVVPEHGANVAPGVLKATTPSSQGALLEKLLGSIATPARSMQQPRGVAQSTTTTTVPCGPPTHAPTLLAAKPMPPPPPLMPAPTYQALQEQWEPPQAAAISTDGFGASYRERLRAGGRGAFQRGFNAGLMPRTMKDEWGSVQMPPAQALPQQTQQTEQVHLATMPVQYDYAMAGDSQQMWTGAEQLQSNEYWGCAQQFDQQMPYQMQMSMAQQAMPPMLPTAAADQSLQMVHMQPQQMHFQQMQPQQLELPQTPMSQMQMATPVSFMSGDSTPSDIDRCMAFLMPEACDKELMALQLKAAAELTQCYED